MLPKGQKKTRITVNATENDQINTTEQFSAASEVFKQLSDPTRVRIFWMLCHSEMCVCNIASELGMSAPAVSYHLSELLSKGLIVNRRDKKETYYTASDNEECHLLHEVVEQVMEMSCPQKALDDKSSPEEIARNAHDFMMESLSERITIEEIAARFHINTTTLKYAFKKVYGSSIANHMKEHRLEHAADLLRRTSTGVANVAVQCGYESQSRFATAFKKKYGVSPSEYRRA